LLRSTLIALGVAAVILVGFVLPSEYGVDPTGVGNALGLTRMGQIKMQLAEEARAEEGAANEAVSIGIAAEESTPTVGSLPVAVSSPVATNGNDWRDETAVLIAPDEAIELKLVMKAGEEAEYQWVAENGVLNFNTHGDGGGLSITYEKGRGAQDGAGTLTASFDGHHGWFWRNRTRETVSLTLRTRGQYSELKRTL
jgi:hypothetical protein